MGDSSQGSGQSILLQHWQHVTNQVALLGQSANPEGMKAIKYS